MREIDRDKRQKPPCSRLVHRLKSSPRQDTAFEIILGDGPHTTDIDKATSNIAGNHPSFVQLLKPKPLRTHVPNSYRAVVVKSVRLYDGLDGSEYDTSGLHVLQLVRDPRGVVNSQMGLWNNPSKIGGNGGDVDPAQVARNSGRILGAV